MRLGRDQPGKLGFVIVFALRLRAMRCDAVRCVACERRRRRALYQAFRTHDPRDSPERVMLPPSLSAAPATVYVCTYMNIAFYDVFMMTGPHLGNKPWIPIRGNAQEGGVAKPWRRTSCPRSALALGSTSPRAPTQLRTHARRNETNPISRLAPPPQPPIYINLFLHTYIYIYIFAGPSAHGVLDR